MKKMNKIVAGISAAALAVSAMATSAFAADTITVEKPFVKTVFDKWVITAKAASSLEADGSTTENAVKWTAALAKSGLFAKNKITITDIKATADSVNFIDPAGATDYTKERTAALNTISLDKLAMMQATGAEEVGKMDQPTNYFFGPYHNDTSSGSTKKAKINMAMTFTFEYTQWDTGAGDLNLLIDSLNTALFNTAHTAYADGDSQTAFETLITKGNVKLKNDIFTIKAVDGASPTGMDLLNTASNTVGDITVLSIERKTTNAYRQLIEYSNSSTEFNGGLHLNNVLLVPQLQSLKGGAKMVVNLVNEVPADKQAVVRATFVNDQGMVFVSSQADYISGGKTLTFQLPAQNTFSSAGTYADASIMFDVVDTGSWTWENKANLLIKSIEFTPNDASVAEGTTEAPKTNEGDSNTNKPASSGDDKNQPTGVAIAIVPAIAAAAGVVISKKRK